MDYLTNDTELTAVADAIREKGDTSDPLEWPDGFIQAIEDCQTGGPELEWLWGNQITNTLSGTIDSTDDAYAGPILDLGVDGVSTQVTTTGKNLLSNVAEDWYYQQYPVVPTNRLCYAIPVESGMSYTYSKGSADALGFIAYLSDDPSDVTNIYNDKTLTNLRQWTFDNSGNHPYLVFNIARSGAAATPELLVETIKSMRIQLEVGSTATSYEPYSGGSASPRPDWPQPILSVDELVIHANDMRGATWWNQIFLLNPRTVTSKGVTYKSTSDGKVTLSGTATGNESFTATLAITIVGGHKYLCNGGNASRGVAVYIGYVGSFPAPGIATAEDNRSITCSVSVASSFSGTYEFYPQLFDLTLMFGAGNEPSTVAEFEAMFPEPYYPYDSGSWLDSDDWPVTLYDGTLRSLPDGTKDQLNLAYLRPSTRAGWAWYGREVVRDVHVMTLDGSGTWGNDAHGCWCQMDELIPHTDSDYSQTIVCDQLKAYPRYTNLDGITGISGYKAYGYSGSNWLYARVDSVGNNAATMKTWLSEHRPTVLYKSTEPPTTTQLDPIELPVLPAPNVTVWCDGGSAQPTFTMEYIQNTNIVISRLEDTIADLATS